MFDQISPLLAIEAKKHQQSLEISVDRSLEVDADRQLLTSAVSNVTQNAIKYTRTNGHVHVHAHRTDGRVIVDVEDECGGLPPGTVDQLFKPFKNETSERSGMGLGLSIAARAMASLHGEIRVHDRPGKGCVFSLELPAATTTTTDDGADPVRRFIDDIARRASENGDFRHVLYTGAHVQVVVMSLRSGEEIGEEVHEHIDHFFLVEDGDGEVTIGSERTAIRRGTAIVVPAGARHNVKATGRSSLKLLTLYAPPEHTDGTVHHTKADAEAAETHTGAEPSR